MKFFDVGRYVTCWKFEREEAEILIINLLSKINCKSIGKKFIIGICVFISCFIITFWWYNIENTLYFGEWDVRFVAGLFITIVLLMNFILMIYFRKRNLEKMYFACMCFLVIAIFIIFYAKYIYGDALYVFTDVGSDMFYGYTTSYMQILEQVRRLDFSSFSLNMGLGNYSYAASNACMDFPFFLVLLFFSRENIYVGLLVVTLLKYIIIAIFSYLFFKRKGNSDKESIVLCLAWTYSSWNILWGQHYWFLTVAVYFTLMMFFLDAAMKINLKYWWLYGFTTGVLSSFNFYSCYTCCAAAGVYVLYETFVQKGINEKRNITKYFVCTVFGVVAFLPFSFKWLWTIGESARTNSAAFTLCDINLNKVFLNIGRFFSSGLFGTSDYHGAINLYEDPVLEISIILLVCCILWAKKGILNKIFLVALFLCTYSDGACIIFNFFPNKRWYIVILFFEILIIADSLKDWRDGKSVLKKSDNYIMAVLVLGIGCLFFAKEYTSYIISDYFIIAFKMFLLIAFWVIFNSQNKSGRINIMYLLIILEIILSNYNVINKRDYVHIDDLNNFINEDIVDLVDKVQQEDTSLYRINNKCARSILSDGALYGYNSTNSYSSMNNAYYIEFIRNLNEIGSAYSMSHDVNHADISCDNYVMKTLLGVKYVISEAPEENKCGLIDSKNGKNLYFNYLYIPMGYCYENSISKEQYLQMSTLEKNLELLYSYYTDQGEVKKGVQNEIIHKEEIAYEQNCVNVQYADRIYSMAETTTDMHMIYIFQDSVDKFAGMQVKFQCESGIAGYGLIIRYMDGEDSKEEYVWLNNGKREYSLFLAGENISQIDIVCMPNEGNMNYFLSGIEITGWRDTYDYLYEKGVSELRKNSGQNIKFRNDTYSADLYCQYENGMYCIPVNYSQNWIAYVNGEKAEVCRINDAMCGIRVTQGNNVIEMKYHYKYYPYICILSILIIGASLYFFVLKCSKSFSLKNIIAKMRCKVENECAKGYRSKIIELVVKVCKRIFALVCMILIYAFMVYNYINFKICVHRGSFFILSIVWIILLFFILKDIKNNNESLKKYLSLIEMAVIPGVSFIIIELMCNPQIAELQTRFIVFNYLLLLLLQMCFILLLGRKSGLYLVATVAFLFGIINYFVIMFKGMPLMPSDFYAIKTAVNVAGQYSFFINDLVVVSFLMYIFELCLIKYIGNTKERKDKVWYIKRLGLVSCFVILCFFLININFQKMFQLGLNAWQPTETYYSYGSVFAFVLEAQQMKPEKVKGYSTKNVEAILGNYDVKNVSKDSAKPNVIIVMNESFSDLSVIGNINTDNCLSNWKNVGYIMRGHAYATQYGGGTCNTEFEVLTGSTMEFIKKGVYPYQCYDLTKVENIIKIFKNNNYSCVAMHPASGQNWNRRKVYADLGFDEFLELSAFDGVEAYHGYISDRGLYKKIEERIEAEIIPTLIFAVTMQNHGGYEISTLEGEKLVQIEDKYAKYDQVITYLTLINESDVAFQELYNYIMSLEEPTVVCMFGDHQPNLGEEFINHLASVDLDAKSEIETRMSRYIVPYIVFSNYDTGIKGLKQDLSLNYLGAKILDIAGYSTPYFEFVNEMQQNIPIVCIDTYMTADGEWHDITEYNSKIDEYRMVEYYNLFEKK